MLRTDREKYEKFFDAFGTSIKFGVYSNYGIHKDELVDLLMFKSSNEEKYVTLEEYKERMKADQTAIHYGSADSIEKIKMLPQADAATGKGLEILYLTDYVDEFAIRTLMQFEEKPFVNICSAEADFDTEEEKEKLKADNASYEEMFKLMKEALGESVQTVRFTHKLKKHPVCLSSEGVLSAEMEKVLNAMPGSSGVKAQLALEINEEHPIAEKLKSLYENDRDTLAKYAKLLYGEARLIGGMELEDPVTFAELVCELM
jgi:molecular chaperone HtpG